MGEAYLDKKPIGLWNYRDREGDCKGCAVRYPLCSAFCQIERLHIHDGSLTLSVCVCVCVCVWVVWCVCNRKITYVCCNVCFFFLCLCVGVCVCVCVYVCESVCVCGCVCVC